jgi:hypothetical protein
VDSLEVLAQHGLEAAAVLAPGQAVQPPREAPDAAGLDDHDRDEDEDGERQDDDDRGEVGPDGLFEIDRPTLPAAVVRSSLAVGTQRGATGTGGILRRLPHPIPEAGFRSMAKRVRSGGRPIARRAAPGRPAGTNPASRPPSPSPAALPSDEPLDIDTGTDDLPKASSAHLSDAELRRSEELQAQIAAQERAALAEQIRRRQRSKAGDVDLEDVNAPLRVRAAKEYAYVARDVRHIAVTGGIMVVILAVLAILINGMGLITF